MDLKNLKTFLYVAEQGSFTRAAELLDYSQSTVSFQIKQLEKELGVPLFERINHTVILTSKGRQVMQYAQKIHKLEEEMHKSLEEKQEISGEVRVVMADSLCSDIFNKRFVDFNKQYPGITLKVYTAGTEEMFRMLNHNDVDMVLTLDSHIYNSDYVIAYEKPIETHFIANPEHMFANRSSLTLQELVDQPFILTEKGMSYRKLMDEKLAARSLEIKPLLEIGNVDQICELIANNAGLAFLPDNITCNYQQQGRVVYLKVEDCQIDIWKQLLYHKDKWVTPAMQKVMELLM